jgi:hypothetical protein
MGIKHEQESNARLIPMDPFPHLSQSGEREPPPYAYTPLTPTTSAPTSPVIPASKAVSVPRPVSPAQRTEMSTFRTLNSNDPLSTCDSRLADIILTNIILPRLRVGVLRYKDRESFEYVPRSKEDVLPRSSLAD